MTSEFHITKAGDAGRLDAITRPGSREAVQRVLELTRSIYNIHVSQESETGVPASADRAIKVVQETGILDTLGVVVTKKLDLETSAPSEDQPKKDK